MFWVDLAKADVKSGASPMTLVIEPDKPLASEVSAYFKNAKPSAG